MKRLFEIDENEKKRILEMHENATKKLYLSEQPTTQSTEQGTPVTSTQGTPRTVTPGGTEINGVIYNMIEINSPEKLDLFLNISMRQIELTANLKYSSLEQSVYDDLFQGIKDALKYGAKTYKSFAATVCTGGIKLKDLNGSSQLFDKLGREFPNIMDVFLPIAKQQMRKLGIKKWDCA